MEKDKISIITVCYNSFHTIEQTILSVLRQSNPAYEYIIIDGGSSDGTVDIIKKYERDIAYWISEPDKGIYDAMNKGLDKATGAYIAFLNSDDWYIDDAVDLVIGAFAENDSDFVYGDYYRVIQNDSICIKARNLDEFYFWQPLCHQAAFAKAQVFEEIGDFDISYKVVADYDWFLRAYMRGKTFHYLDRPLVYFRALGVHDKEFFNTVSEGRSISLKHLPDSKRAELAPIIEAFYYERIKGAVLFRMDGYIRTNVSCLRELWSEYIDRNEMVYIWGCGAMGKSCLKYLRAIGAYVEAFIDADPAKWNTTFKNIKITDADILRNKKIKVIVTPEKFAQEIRGKLTEWGYHEKEDFFLYTDIIRGIAGKLSVAYGK